MQSLALSACNTFQAHGLTSFMQFLIQSLMKACSGSRMKQTVAWTFEPSFEPLCHSMLNQLNQLNQLLSLPPISPNRSESVRIGPNRSESVRIGPNRSESVLSVSSTNRCLSNSACEDKPADPCANELVKAGECYHMLPSSTVATQDVKLMKLRTSWAQLSCSQTIRFKAFEMMFNAFKSFKHIYLSWYFDFVRYGFMQRQVTKRVVVHFSGRLSAP